MLRMLRTGVIGVVALALVPPAVAAAAMDSAHGTARQGNALIHFNARSDPGGADASGRVFFEVEEERLHGEVICLTVTGTKATVGGMITHPSSPPTWFWIFAEDGDPSGQPDRLRIQFMFDPITTCPTEEATFPVTHGNVVVSDAPA